jgi:hypothetical protein
MGLMSETHDDCIAFVGDLYAPQDFRSRLPLTPHWICNLEGPVTSVRGHDREDQPQGGGARPQAHSHSAVPQGCPDARRSAIDASGAARAGGGLIRTRSCESCSHQRLQSRLHELPHVAAVPTTRQLTTDLNMVLGWSTGPRPRPGIPSSVFIFDTEASATAGLSTVGWSGCP